MDETLTTLILVKRLYNVDRKERIIVTGNFEVQGEGNDRVRTPVNQS
jgi:hypothetical protein